MTVKIELKTPDGWNLTLSFEVKDFEDIVKSPEIRRATRKLLDKLDFVEDLVKMLAIEKMMPKSEMENPT